MTVVTYSTYSATMRAQCHVCKVPINTILSISARVAMRNAASLRKGSRLISKGLTRAIDPAITVAIKPAAPTSSPTAMLELPDDTAANVEKMSGLPLPMAKTVTPASVSLRCRLRAIVVRLTAKKSPATVPIVRKRMQIQIMPRDTLNDFRCASWQ